MIFIFVSSSAIVSTSDIDEVSMIHDATSDGCSAPFAHAKVKKILPINEATKSKDSVV